MSRSIFLRADISSRRLRRHRFPCTLCFPFPPVLSVEGKFRAIEGTCEPPAWRFLGITQRSLCSKVDCVLCLLAFPRRTDRRPLPLLVYFFFSFSCCGSARVDNVRRWILVVASVRAQFLHFNMQFPSGLNEPWPLIPLFRLAIGVFCLCRRTAFCCHVSLYSLASIARTWNSPQKPQQSASGAFFAHS